MSAQLTEDFNLKQPKSVSSRRGEASIAGNAFYLATGRGLYYISRFVYVIGLAYYLGPASYGLFSYGMSWYLAFLPLAGLGLGIILSREVGRDRNNGTQVVAQTLTLQIFAAIVAGILCGVIGWLHEGQPETRRLLLVFSIALIGRVLGLWTENVFTAYEANKYSLQQEVIFRPLEVAFGLMFLMAGGGSLAVAIVHAISWWLQALRGMILARSHIVAIRLDWAWNNLKGVFIQSMPIAVCFIFVNWLQQGPLVLFRHTGGTEISLGQLALAVQAFILACTVPTAIGMAALPVLSRTIARQDGKEELFVEMILRAGLVLGATGGLIAIGIGPWLVHLLFGPQYRYAGELLGPALFLIIPWTWGFVLWQILLARRKFLFPILGSAIGALVMTLTMPLLVSLLDALGALIATAAGMGIWAICLIALVNNSVKLNFSFAIFKPGTAVLLALSIFYVLHFVNSLLALSTGLLALFVGMLSFGGLSPEEKSILFDFFRRKRTKV